MTNYKIILHNFFFCGKLYKLVSKLLYLPIAGMPLETSRDTLGNGEVVGVFRPFFGEGLFISDKAQSVPLLHHFWFLWRHINEGEVEKKTPKKRWRIPHFYYITWIKSQVYIGLRLYLQGWILLRGWRYPPPKWLLIFSGQIGIFTERLARY